MEKIFKLKENGTNVKTEILAGLTTFMTMAYIIALNPNLLTGFDRGSQLWNGVFLATCIASAIAMFVMAFLANKPFALAPGMGLNSFFAVVVANIVGLTGLSYLQSFQAALCIILIEGIVFLILSLLNIREKIVDCIPLGVRMGIAPGIGLMLMNIGLGSNVGIYSADGGPFYVMRDFFGALTPSVIKGNMGDAYPEMVLTVVTMFVGLFAICILAKLGVKGAVLLGMLISCIIYWAGEAIFLGNNPFASLATASFVPPFADMAATTLFKFDFKAFFSIGWFTIITLIITFCMIDMFDTIGTFVGTASRAGMMDKNGKMPKMKEALVADAVGTIAGAVTGTSTVTTFVESASGVEAGGLHRSDRADHRYPLPGLHLHRSHCRDHSRCRYFRSADLCRCSDAQRTEKCSFRRPDRNRSCCADAHFHADFRIDRPWYWTGPDCLHCHQSFHRQSQRCFVCYLHHFRSVLSEILPGCVSKNPHFPKEGPFGPSFFCAYDEKPADF